MKSIVFLLTILTLVCVAKPHTANAETLAETINNCKPTEQINADEVHYATIFCRSTLSAYDELNYDDNAKEYVWLKTLADIDGYKSAVIDEKAKSALTTIEMTGHMPITFITTEGMQPLIVWLSSDRYLYNAYDYAKQFNLETSKWNKTQAGQEVLDCYHKAGSGLAGFDLDDGWKGTRYYDEYAQTLDLLNKFGFVSDASQVWSDINRLQPYGHWTGEWYGYTIGGGSEYECEMGSFALLIGNYYVSQNYNLSNFERITTDLYNKMLVDGWNSPAWGIPAVVHHGEYSPVLRLESTLTSIIAMHTYYYVAPEYWRAKFRSMIDGNLTSKAWELLINSPMYSSGKFSLRNDRQYADYATWCGMMNLFLEGIIPDTGSLAIPLNEWRYQDWSSMIPVTHFKFDYENRKIRIPVISGAIKFQFGTNVVSVDFPSDGIYEITFNQNWDIALNTRRISNLQNSYYLKIQASQFEYLPILLVIASILVSLIVIYKKYKKKVV